MPFKKNILPMTKKGAPNKKFPSKALPDVVRNPGASSLNDYAKATTMANPEPTDVPDLPPVGA